MKIALLANVLKGKMCAFAWPAYETNAAGVRAVVYLRCIPPLQPSSIISAALSAVGFCQRPPSLVCERDHLALCGCSFSPAPHP